MEFEDLSNKLKIKLIEITSKDPYSLKPLTLYRNILYSTGSDESLAKIFDVPLWVVKEIKDQSR